METIKTTQVKEQGQTAIPVHIGMIDCLYTAPVSQIWKERKTRQEWILKEFAADELRLQLEAKNIDIGFIPAFAYAKNSSHYKLLPGISISSASAIGIGILFSHLPLEQLARQSVQIPSELTSTAALTRIILEEWHKVVPQYLLSEQREIVDKEVRAVLASGDHAARLAEKPDFLYQFDLGDIWKRKMEMPFVFAVCVVRENFAQQYPDIVQEIHQELLLCRDIGLAELNRICQLSAEKIPFSVDKCSHYLEGIRYELAGKERSALESFMQILIDREEVVPTVLPLDFFTCEQQE